MLDKERLKTAGLGAAGGGALLAATTLIAENDYWLLMTGTAFVLVGLSIYFGSNLIKG